MSIILSTPSLVETSTWTDPGNLYISGRYATRTLSRRTTSGVLTIEYEDLNRYKIKEIYIRVYGKSSGSSCTVTLTDENNITLASSLSLSVNSDSVIKSSNLVDKINQDKVTINLTVYNGSSYSSNISIEGVSLEIVGEEIIEDETPGIIDSKNMYLGDMHISKLYLGNNSISELYLGNTLIYGTSKGVVTDGLRYYLDGRDFISGSNEWLPQVSKNPYDELVKINGYPDKIGNCVKLAGGLIGQSFFYPSIPATTFTFECYIKDIGQINDVSLWRFLGPIYSYGMYCTVNTYSHTPEMWIDGVTSSGFSFECILDPHKFKSLYIQITCLNGEANVYVNGELVKTGSNFGLYEEETSLVLGDIFQFIGEPTFSSIRYYERALTKDELDKNRQFDLSIY